MKPIAAALKICALPNKLLTFVGRFLRRKKYSIPMMMKPSTNPINGDVNIGTMTFHKSPPPIYQCTTLGCAQMITSQLLCAAASADPHNPPINAWLELDGNPNHHVTRFQMMAPTSAQMMMPEVIATALESTSPEVMVLATAVPHIAPNRLVTAANITAWRGVRTLVETTVAMELAVS